MKFKKKTIFILAICWIVGIAGGYFIGVESASIPSEYIDYNFYSSDYAKSSVKTVDHNSEDDCNEEESRFTQFVKSLNLIEIPKKIFNKIISPSACNQQHLEDQEEPVCDSLA